MTHAELSDLAGELIVPKGEAALVTTEGMTKLALLVPQFNEEQKKDVPRLLLYLTACMVRGEQDEEFREEQIQWFMEGAH